MTTPDLKKIIRVLRDYAIPMTGERLGERHPTICGWTWDEIEKEVSSRQGVTVEDAANTLDLAANWMEKAVKDKRIIGPEFHVPTLRKAARALTGEPS